MGRGIISGMLLGAVFSTAVLAAVSMVLPLPAVPPQVSLRPMPSALVSPVIEVPATGADESEAAPTAMTLSGTSTAVQTEAPTALTAPVIAEEPAMPRSAPGRAQAPSLPEAAPAGADAPLADIGAPAAPPTVATPAPSIAPVALGVTAAAADAAAPEALPMAEPVATAPAGADAPDAAPEAGAEPRAEADRTAADTAPAAATIASIAQVAVPPITDAPVVATAPSASPPVSDAPATTTSGAADLVPPATDAPVLSGVPAAAPPAADTPVASDASAAVPSTADVPFASGGSDMASPATDALAVAAAASDAADAAVPVAGGFGTESAAQVDLSQAKTEPPPDAEIRPGMVEVPAGSEFARGAGDKAPRLPAAEAAPQATSAPVAPALAADAPPALASTAPARRPEAEAEPSAPAAPTAGMLAPLPGGEQPLPVPPAGEAVAPELPPTIASASDLPAAPGVPSRETVVADTRVAAAAADAPLPAPGNTAAVPDLSDQPEIILLPEPAPRPDTTPPIEPGFADIPQVGFGVRQGAGFTNVPGVVVDRLPSIGAADQTAPESADAAALLAPLSALQRFRQPFTPTGAPLLSIILLDPGPEAGGLARATLKALSFPLTIALDPMRPDASEAAADYRAAGFEVAILAAPLPVGATAVDLEVALSAWRKAIPEAVAVIEPPEPVVQANHGLSQQLVAALARDGLGLVTQSDKGLNAAAQVAAVAGLPQASVWRVLDARQDKAPAVMRYLDRARFEAAQGAGVAVMVHGWPDTVRALRDWVRTKDASVDLAPVSALALLTSAGAAP